jgi:hypothetical protein
MVLTFVNSREPVPISEATSGNNPLKYTDPSGNLFYYKGAWISDYKDWVSNPFGSGGCLESSATGGGSRRGDSRLDAYSTFVKSLGPTNADCREYYNFQSDNPGVSIQTWSGAGGKAGVKVVAEWNGEWVYFANHGYSYVYNNKLTFRTISLESVNAISEPWIPHPRRDEGIIGESSWKNFGVWVRDNDVKIARIIAVKGASILPTTSVIKNVVSLAQGKDMFTNQPFSTDDKFKAFVDTGMEFIPGITLIEGLIWDIGVNWGPVEFYPPYPPNH